MDKMIDFKDNSNEREIESIRNEAVNLVRDSIGVRALLGIGLYEHIDLGELSDLHVRVREVGKRVGRNYLFKQEEYLDRLGPIDYVQSLEEIFGEALNIIKSGNTNAKYICPEMCN